MGEWASRLPETQTLRVGGISLFVLHDVKDCSVHREAADVQVVVYGHSHKPQITRNPAGVLWINPGSAGPRRFKLPVSAAELMVADDRSLVPRLVNLI
jgi:predicted phosphodiesterase